MLKTIKNNTTAATLLILAITLFVSHGLAGTSFAQGTPKETACGVIEDLTGAGGCTDVDSQAGEESVSNIAGDIVGILSAVAGAVAVIFFIVGGIKYASSGGNPEKVKSAKATMLAALVGFALIIATQFIINIAVSFTETATGDGGGGGEAGVQQRGGATGDTGAAGFDDEGTTSGLR